MIIVGRTRYGSYHVSLDDSSLTLTLQVLLPRKVSERILAGPGRLALTLTLDAKFPDERRTDKLVLDVAAQYSLLLKHVPTELAERVTESVENLKKEARRGSCIRAPGWAVANGGVIGSDCIRLKCPTERDWVVLKNVATRVAVEALAAATAELRKRLLAERMRILKELERVDKEILLATGLDIAANVMLAKRLEKRLAGTDG